MQTKGAKKARIFKEGRKKGASRKYEHIYFAIY